MSNKIDIHTFDFVDKNRIPSVATSDEFINKHFERVQKNVEKGNAYSICRIEYDYFMLIRHLQSENKRLRSEIKELKENSDKNKTIEKIYVSSRYEPWIDNGQPDESWRTIHEMGEL